MAPCRVDRMHSSVCAPATTRLPMPRSANTSSSEVSSNESANVFSTSASSSTLRLSSGTSCQSSLPRTRYSLECCTHTTGTFAVRALSTRVATLATTASRAWAPSTTPFWTSMTRSAVFGRLSSVVMSASRRRVGAVSYPPNARTMRRHCGAVRALERGDGRARTLAAGKRAHHRRLPVFAQGDASQQREDGHHDLVGKGRRVEADADREVVAVNGDLHEPGEQEVVDRQRPGAGRRRDAVVGRQVRED